MLVQTTTQKTDSKVNWSSQNKKVGADELTIISKSEFVQPSAMSEEQKQQKREDAPALNELFVDVLKEKKEYREDKIDWIDDDTVMVKNISKMALHNLVLKAEEMGKEITYVKQTIIKISK